MMRQIAMPDAVGDDAIEAKAELRPAARQRDHEFRIDERLAAGEAEDADAERVGLFEEVERDGDFEEFGPFDRHAAMGAFEVALIGAGKGDVVRPKGPRPTSDRPTGPASAAAEESTFIASILPSIPPWRLDMDDRGRKMRRT